MYSEAGLTNLVVINATRPVLVCVCCTLRSDADKTAMHAPTSTYNEFSRLLQRSVFVLLRVLCTRYIIVLRMCVCECVCTISVYNIGVVTPSPSVIKTLWSLVTRGQHIIYHILVYYARLQCGRDGGYGTVFIINYSKPSIGRRFVGE